MVENRSDFLEPRMRRKEQQGRWFSVVALIGSAASERTPACYVPVVYEGNASTKYAERTTLISTRRAFKYFHSNFRSCSSKVHPRFYRITFPNVYRQGRKFNYKSLATK
ncbi:hypothetical protein HZH66_004591 [Vespula vulgaris]|uniref:Uncharacterized protein n=1 Tax=Vespula vulgaris TaxID=7454 RepID=A0A834K8C4_VESVU|nr:hypothetical protein HZH66_004591 [Vespula vulgaris]